MKDDKMPIALLAVFAVAYLLYRTRAFEHYTVPGPRVGADDQKHYIERMSLPDAHSANLAGADANPSWEAQGPDSLVNSTDNYAVPPEDGSFPAALLEDRRGEAPLEAQDLLPADPNSAWSTVNPEGRGSIAYKNFLEATYHFGVDTVGSSLRNANQQLRSEPPNPRLTVSPWLQSTISTDTNKRDFEIGSSAA